MRWLRPPPAATAAFSSARSPGVVLRVSRMRAPVPATASTKRAVRVAMPERWPRKLSAVRSATSSAAAGPLASSTSAGTPSRHWPSTTSRSTCSTPHWRIVSSTRSNPKATPASFCTIRARARASLGTVAAVVTSPAPTSSARARATISLQRAHRA